MSFQLVNIISAIGNNSSIYPLLVRDCGIEIPSKVTLTYIQNLKESKQMADNAFRERMIDEYGTSAIWLGGIPLIDYLCNKAIKKIGYNPNINMSVFKKNCNQYIENSIKSFKNKAPKEVKELEKILQNKKTYEKLIAGKFILSTAIPITLMGFVLPKLNFALTNKIKNNEIKPTLKPQNNNTDVSFRGISSSLSNISTVNKMAITDGGLTVGRVTTARNKYEKTEMAFKMLSMMFLNFVAPKWIAKFFDAASNKLFNTSVNLDPKIFKDKEFLNAVKTSSLKLPKNNFIEFLDNNPYEIFSKLTAKYCGVNYLDNAIRDPRVFINETKINTFKKEIEKFSIQAIKSGNIDKFAKKALIVKSANIFANIGISSFLLAYALPKITFILRKRITGSEAEPGLI